MQCSSVEKVFNRMSRNEIKINLENRNVNNKLRQAILSLYRITRYYVRTDNMESLEFVVEEGVRQGRGCYST